MKKRYIATIILMVMLITTSVIMAQTRRTRSEEFLRKTINIEETQPLSATIRVCDPDGDDILISIDDLPEGAILTDIYVIEAEDPNDYITDPNCADCFVEPITTSWFGADIEWTPTYEQEGTYTLHIHAMDDKGADDWVIIVINVAGKNRSPVL